MAPYRKSTVAERSLERSSNKTYSYELNYEGQRFNNSTNGSRVWSVNIIYTFKTGCFPSILTWLMSVSSPWSGMKHRRLPHIKWKGVSGSARSSLETNVRSLTFRVVSTSYSTLNKTTRFWLLEYLLCFFQNAVFYFLFRCQILTFLSWVDYTLECKWFGFLFTK